MSNFYNLVEKHGLPISLANSAGYLMRLVTKTPKGHYLGWYLNSQMMGQTVEEIPCAKEGMDGWELYDENVGATICPTCGKHFSKAMVANRDNFLDKKEDV